MTALHRVCRSSAAAAVLLAGLAGSALAQEKPGFLDSVQGGLARAQGSSPDAPALGLRVGVGHQPSRFGPAFSAIAGPHASLGLPLTPHLGVRTEAGALPYLAREQLPGGRAYVSIGLQARR